MRAVGTRLMRFWAASLDLKVAQAGAYRLADSQADALGCGPGHEVSSSHATDHPAWRTRRRVHWLWWVGTLAVAMNYIATSEAWTSAKASFVDIFNSRWLNWLGLINRKPVTDDYLPVMISTLMAWGFMSR